MANWMIWNPINILNIFKPSYYFDDNLTLTFLGWGYWIFVAFVLACIVGSYIIPRKTKNLPYLQRQIWLRIASTAGLFGWLMLVWLFFRYQGVKYLAWRFWPALLWIYTLVQVGWMIKFAKFDFPAKRASKISGQAKDIYLKKYLKR